jgi:hypothetical protein
MCVSSIKQSCLYLTKLDQHFSDKKVKLDESEVEEWQSQPLFSNLTFYRFLLIVSLSYTVHSK